jgi:hypothetical protein
MFSTMKRKKELLDKELSEMVSIKDKVIISKDKDGWFFEVGKEITSDIAEAVVILMRDFSWNHDIWETEVDKIKIENITPEKSLFWLTGGYKEWRSLEHYNRPWCDCYLEFQEEFGFLIINIVKKAKKMGDIRDGFMRYLNLPILYDFAVGKDLVK